jgi:hypothetical protein
MSLLIWSIAAFVTGIGIYVVGPLLVAPILPDGWRRRAAEWYWRQAMVTAGRLQVVERDHGTHTLMATDYKAEWGDEGQLDGETGHWSDNRNNMGRLFGRPFGLVSERFNVVLHPRLCEVGREHERQLERNKTEFAVETDGGEVVSCQEPRAQLPQRRRLVSAHDGEAVLGDSADPWLGELSYDFTEKSQQGFSKRNIVEAMTFVIAYAAAFGMFWFIAKQGGNVSSSLTLMLGVGA